MFLPKSFLIRPPKVPCLVVMAGVDYYPRLQCRPLLVLGGGGGVPTTTTTTRPLVSVTASCWRSRSTRGRRIDPTQKLPDYLADDGYRIYNSRGELHQPRNNKNNNDDDGDNDDDDINTNINSMFGDDDPEEEEEELEIAIRPFPEQTDFPQEVIRIGNEMDVRIVKVQTEYALCRPVDYPHLKGKISVLEMDEFDATYDAHLCVEENIIYRAYVWKLQPPDRILFSLKRVRRVLRDDFQPFTVCFLYVPYDLSADQMETLMDAKILNITFSTVSPIGHPNLRSFAFVTFLHEADGRAAIRKWNVTKMPCTVGDTTLEFRVRARKAHEQTYRANLQMMMDDKLQQKLQLWNETPMQRRVRKMADRDLRLLIPYYCEDRDYQGETYDLVRFTPEYEYSIKNNPRAPS